MSSTTRGTAASIVIQLLGQFTVSVGTRVVAASEWRRRKPARLVKLLALAHQHQLHREQIMNDLWPDLNPAAAANNLHQALHLARRVLDPEGKRAGLYLQIRSEVVELGPEGLVWVDVEAFEAAAAQARQIQSTTAYRSALDLYGGDLLPEDRYDDGIGPRRELLRRTYLDLLMGLAARSETDGAWDEAIQARQQALLADSSHEDAHTGLIRLYAQTGQRQAALRQYRQLEEALREELQAEPGAEAQRLHADLLAGRWKGEGDPVATARPAEASAGAAARHNLLSPLTRFIGRQREKVEIKRRQADTRLLTLVGPGGCGKTRLGLEVAADLAAAEGYRGGVWWVELAALSDPRLVPQAVASVLGVHEAPPQPLVETLRAHLQANTLLLVLDNCEHLIEACARLASALLRACPGLKIVATSREPLHIPGELTWPVPPLSLPDPQQMPPVDALGQFEAIELFVDRATAALPSFRVTEANATALVQVCRRLDGLPLALELAAARVRVLSVAEIAARLENSFGLLVSDSRITVTRQQTLKATLDWSHDLLSERERVLFRRLAVFAGSFTLEAVEAVSDGADQHEALDLLSQLVDKSLALVRDEGRYGLLETVAQYALEKLRAAGEEARTRTRHQAWYLRLAERAEPELYGPEQSLWLRRLKAELDNLRAALAWRDPEAAEEWTALRLARALFWFWYAGSYLGEGRAFFEKALAETETIERTWVRATALFGSGIMAMYQSDFVPARHRLEESAAVWGELGNEQERAMALFGLSTAAINQGDTTAARALLEECLRLFGSSGRGALQAIALMHLGDLALEEGHWAGARGQYEQALARQREQNHTWGIAQALNNLGDADRCEGQYERARQHYEASLQLFRGLDNASDVARSLHNLGYVAAATGNWEQATARFTESLALFKARGTQRGLIEGLAGLASVLARQGPPAGNSRRAAELLGAVEALAEALGARLWPADRLEFRRAADAVRAELGNDELATAWAEGRALSLEQALARAGAQP